MKRGRSLPLYLLVSGAVFTAVSAIHLVRLIFGLPVAIGRRKVPRMLSIFGLPIAAGYAAWAFSLLRKETEPEPRDVAAEPQTLATPEVPSHAAATVSAPEPEIDPALAAAEVASPPDVPLEAAAAAAMEPEPEFAEPVSEPAPSRMKARPKPRRAHHPTA